VSSPNDRELTVFIDALSISPIGSLKKAWFLFDFSAEQTTPKGNTYKSMLQLTYFNCPENTQAPKMTTYYSEPGGKGTVKDLWRPDPLRFDELPPSSRGAGHQYLVCKSK
jgi:hypothetical protein